MMKIKIKQIRATDVKEVLLRLAAEEGAHKDVFEKEYDDRILGSN